MDLKEALPLLEENHLAVATSITRNRRSQATVVSTALMEGKLIFASPANTVKVKNINGQPRKSYGYQVRDPALRYSRRSCVIRALARHTGAH
jgi:hypothetical protein